MISKSLHTYSHPKELYSLQKLLNLMTDKEIYKARAEGYNRIAEISNEVSDNEFLEFMGFIREVTNTYQSDIETIKQEVMEKSEIRKKLIELFKNESI